MLTWLKRWRNQADTIAELGISLALAETELLRLRKVKIERQQLWEQVQQLTYEVQAYQWHVQRTETEKRELVEQLAQARTHTAQKVEVVVKCSG